MSRTHGLVAALLLGLLALACSSPADDEACGPEGASVARVWNEQALDAIRRDFPAPTVHARNLYHLSALGYDIWVAYGGRGEPVLVDGQATGTDDERIEAMAHGAHHLLTHRYRNAVGAEESQAGFDAAIGCYGPADGAPAELGVAMATELIETTIDDGSRETSGYTDLGYASVNLPLVVDRPGAGLIEPGRWQPLSLAGQTTQNGIVLADAVQEFIGPQWGFVTPFAIEANQDGLPIDPGPPPAAGTQEYLEAAIEVIDYGARLGPAAGRTIRIDPGAAGDRPIDADEGTGRRVNPATGEPYLPNEVDEADYGRVVAEYWADGPDSETPPGHWNIIANRASDQLADHGPLRISGTAEVDRLEWDVKLHLALNGALHDAAIAAWGSKAHYDYVRPISMIRHLGETGQLPAVDGLIEATDGPVPLVRGWLGQPDEPATQRNGVDWIPATEWVPYQRASFVTPSFASYVSGHSAFSRAGAEILSVFTDDPYFPGGLAEHVVEPGDLIHEAGPSETVTLQWATYRDAADEAGRSRLYGGIHIPADDLAGRRVGLEVGVTAWDRAAELFGLDDG